METDENLWAKPFFTIGPESRESFVPLDNPAVRSLKEKGMIMAGYSRLKLPYALCRTEPRIDVAQFTLAGRGKLTTDRGVFPLTSGTMLLLPAGCPHRYRIDGKEWEIIWYHFGSNNFWKPAWGKEERIEKFPDFSRMARTIKDLLADINSPFPLSSRLAEYMAGTLTLLLDRKLHKYTNPHQYALYQKFDSLWNRVNCSLSSLWTVDRMACEMNLSVSHFSRLCREIHGISPSRKLRQFRLDRAKSLLIHNDFTVYQVAEMIGYGDPFAFSTAFKAYTGKTPREWRPQ